MWMLAVIGLLAVIVGLVGLYAMRREKTPFEPMSAGMAAGGIVGVVIGILLVEFAGFDYPFPFILWLLGMAAGQLIGWLYKKKGATGGRRL